MVRGRVWAFADNLNWFLFDAVFKPFTVAGVIILERWFYHRAGKMAGQTTFYLACTCAADEQAAKMWGPGSWPGHVLCRFASLFALFGEVDTAYKCFFIGWIRGVNDKLKDTP